MHRALVSPRRGAAVLVVIVGCLAGLLPAAFGQDESSTSASAVLTQDGWWNRAKGPQTGEPANPVRSNIGGAIPAPSTVPENGLGVGAVGGDTDKVAAVGLILEAPPEALVDRLVLTLRETPENGSQVNTASAKIVACPITSFWAGVKNGDFVNRPTCDPAQAVPGTRAPGGTWTFDLTLFATAWLDPTSGLQQNGVLLVEAVDAPVSFQTSFSDITTDRVSVDFAATDVGGGGDDLSDTGSAAEDFTTTDDTATFEDVPVDRGGVAFDDGASFDTTASEGFATAPEPAVPEPAPTAPVEVATPAAETRPRADVGLFDAIPLPALLLLLLLLGGVGLFLALVLGPMAAPATAPVRTGGVSRALAERAASRTR